MDKVAELRVRWIVSGVLSVILGAVLHSVFSWNSWLSVLASLIMLFFLAFAWDFWAWLQKKFKFWGAGKSRDESPPFVQIALGQYRKLLQIKSEKEILDIAMDAGLQLLPVSGASFVPYDEWGRSLPALMQGKVPGPVLQSWTQRLSSPNTRQICKNCKTMHGEVNCVLLSPEQSTSSRVHCFPLISAGREVGVINLYSEGAIELDGGASRYYSDILEAAGLALETLRSRDQEISALHYLQTITSQKSDLSILLNSLVENVQHALEVDFALLYLPGGIPGKLNPHTRLFTKVKGDSSISDSFPDLPFMEGIWRSVISSGRSLSLENVTLDKQEKWKTLQAVPLVWRGEEPAGVLVLGSSHAQSLNQRHLVLLETLSGQAALLIQNARLMVQLEYQAVVDERTRLAREIHDGLAQTLAFLKIQSAQMQNLAARGEIEKLTNTLQANYRTLSDAYIDARQAIDNLRRVPSSDLHDWISQVAADFEQSTNQKINVSIAEFSSEYPINVQAQLIRIVQEALSNVRKHADASIVNIVGKYQGDYYLLEIFDNGRGFSPTEDSHDGNSHYGLRGMRERSETIGIDFQITSQPGNGTCISLGIPVVAREEV